MGERDGLELVEADLFDEEAGRRPPCGRRRPTEGAPLRAVANLVGGYLAGPRVHETTLEEFEGQFRLNLRPTFLVTRAALPRLVEAGGGGIVCMSARAAMRPLRGRRRLRLLQGGGARLREVRRGRVPRRGRALQRGPAERDRHSGQPRRRARRRPLPLGPARPRSRE